MRNTNELNSYKKATLLSKFSTWFFHKVEKVKLIRAMNEESEEL